MKSIQIAGAFTLFTGLILHSAIVKSGTIVEIKSDNEISTIMTDGKQARMNSTDSDYIIVNYADHSVKVVDTEKHQVMLLNMDGMPKGGKSAKVQTALKNLGSGPSIAGYKTQKFSYTVNGQPCGVIYGSKEAYKLKSIKGLFSAMTTMAERQQAMMGGFVGMMDNCSLGDLKMAEHVDTVGVPMRTEDKGVVDSEVISIKLDVSLPADTFVIPKSYKTVTMEGEMQKMKKDMSNMQQQVQQYQPQMQQMMQQMQQSGQLPPEVMEKMRRAQEQMKQYQQ